MENSSSYAEGLDLSSETRVEAMLEGVKTKATRSRSHNYLFDEIQPAMHPVFRNQDGGRACEAPWLDHLSHKSFEPLID